MSAVSGLARTIGQFWKAYVTDGGRRDGVPGLFFAVHCGMREFLTFAKHWELKRNA